MIPRKLILIKDLIQKRFPIELILPLAIIIAYVFLLFAIRGSMPTPEELVGHFTALYQRFGYEIIFIGAVLEALIVVNFFVPGVTALVLGGVFARSGQLELTLVVLAATAGALVGYTIDFILGFLGFGKVVSKMGYSRVLEKARRNVNKFNIVTTALGFIHPNVGSFMSVAGGTLELPFNRFLILASLMSLFWFSVWGLLVFAVGDIFLTILTRHFFVVLIIVFSVLILSAVYGNKKD